MLPTLVFLIYLAIVGYYFTKAQILFKNGNKMAARRMVRRSFLIFIVGAVIGMLLIALSPRVE
jgi:hypothetical protein